MSYPNDSVPQEVLTNKEVIQKSPIEFIIGINQKNFVLDNPQLKFFVKLRGRKYADSIWISKVKTDSDPTFDPKLIENFQLSLKESSLSPVPFVSCLYKPDNIIFDESFFHPEEILATKKEGTEIFYLVKWENLPVDQATWENNSDTCIPTELFLSYKLSKNKPNPTVSQPTESFQNPSQFIPLTESPTYKDDNRLTSYQLNGLNWLVDKWYNNRNSILADESGIGKKVQIVAFTEEIHKMTGYSGPFLVITSLSSINSWLNVFKKWTNFRIIKYIGTEKQLEIIREYVLFTDNTKKFIKYDIVLTTYDVFNSHFNDFKQIQWISIYIDELIPEIIHNPNFESLELITDHIIILTQFDITTQVINDIYSLFHLLENDTFSDLEVFIQEYSNPNIPLVDIEKFSILSQDYVLRRGKDMLDPILLKMSTKQPYLNDNEVVIAAEPTQYQIDMFKKFFLSRRPDFIFNENSLHCLFTLRKIANHPFLDADEMSIYQNDPKSKEEEVKMLIEASGKMIIMDKLLERFIQQNEKVLILSNMTEMVNLIDLYLQKKGIRYERLDDSYETMINIHDNQQDVSCYLSCVHTFSMYLKNTEKVLIFDGHFTPKFENKTIYRLFTHGTVEEDLFIKFFVKKDFSSPTKEDVNFLMRENAYFAFHGQIDKSYITEPIEKAMEYRTAFDFSSRYDSLDDSDFWIDLYKKEDLIKIDQIPIEIDKLRQIAKLIMNIGCFETQSRYQKEHNNDSHFNFLLVCLIYSVYKNVDKELRKIFKGYIQKVRKLCKEIIVSKYVINREPLSNRSFIFELFGDDLFLTMMKITSLDRIYICLSFMSSPEFNKIGFIFAQSMNCPVYWNDYYDYVLMYTSCMYGTAQSNIKAFKSNLESINIPVGNLPLSSSYNFSSSEAPDFTIHSITQPNMPSIDSGVINLPNSKWLKQRITLIVSEMEAIIPLDYFPLVRPLSPSKWIDFYNPDLSIHLETRNMIKRVLRFLFLYGFIPSQANSKTFLLKGKMNLISVPDEIVESIIYSLIKSAADLISSNQSYLSNDDRYIFLKSRGITSNMKELLYSLIKDITPIRLVDISWVRKDALLLLAKQLIFFIRVRDLCENMKYIKMPYFEHPKWNGAPSWWDAQCNYELINAVSTFGFVFLSVLKKLKEINKNLTQNDRFEIENFRIYEKKMLGDIRVDLPHSLKDHLAFIKKIENRILILEKLMSILMVPTVKELSNFLPRNKLTGLQILNIGKKNEKGCPIGYYAIRFYRAIDKPPKPSNAQKNDDDLFCSFYCMIIKSATDEATHFIIRNLDNSVTKMFEVRALSINQAYKLFIDTLIEKGIKLPPPYFDGYQFFGFKTNFIRSIISSTP